MRCSPFWLLFAWGLFCSGCGSPVRGQDSASAPLPPEYPIVAKHLTKSIYAEPGKFQEEEAKTVAAILAEGHEAALDLANVKPQDAELREIAGLGVRAFTELVAGLKNLDAMPKAPGITELIVESSVHGYFGNFLGVYGVAIDAMDKHSALLAEFEKLIIADRNAQTASFLLPKIARKYAPAKTEASDRLLVDFEEAWGPFGPHDWLTLYNNGSDLFDCTLLVELAGAQGERQKNVHFVEHWPSKTYLYARYSHGKEVPDLGKTVDRYTVNKLQTLTVSLWSPTFACQMNYLYQGEESDKDIARLCENLSIVGRFIPFEVGVIWNTERGAELSLQGVSLLPESQLTLTFKKGTESLSWFWNLDEWSEAEAKTFHAPEGKLPFDPEQIDV